MAETLPAPAAMPRGARFWAFVAFMLVLMALFIGLGTWQVERLGEKERLIASVASRMDLAPVALPPISEWAAFDPGAFDFRPVVATGRFRPELSVLVFASLDAPRGTFSGPGYWVMTPFELATGGTLFVNRGFVPQQSGPAFAAGGAVDTELTSITGTARAPEASGSFTPSPDTARRIEWVRDPVRLAKMAGQLSEPIAPIYVDLPAGPAGSLPQGGETVVEFPNNHLGYAMTWYGFALLVPVLLWFWARRPARAAAKP